MGARFQMSERYKLATEAAVRLVARTARGGRITHADLSAAAGIEPRTPEWAHLVRLVKRACRDSLGVVLWCVVPGTYTVLLPADQIKLPAEKRGRRARRQLGMAEKEVASTPDDLLGEHDRIAKAFRVDALRGQRTAIDTRDKLVRMMLPAPRSQ
jgi:hypothetical protein